MNRTSWRHGVTRYQWLVLFVAWLIALVNGHLPRPLHQALTALLRYQIRFYCYYWMLTPAYPWGLFGDAPGMPPAAAGYAATVPAAPLEGTPAVVDGTPAPDTETLELRQRVVISTLLAVPVVLIAMIPALQFDAWQWMSLTLAAPVVPSKKYSVLFAPLMSTSAMLVRSAAPACVAWTLPCRSRCRY